MRTKNKLYELIHSMNKNEKRFFKLYTQITSKEQKQYLLLYDILEEMEKFDPKALNQKIDLDKKRLNNLSIYLKKQLLHSLQIYHRNSNDQLQASDRLFSAQILIYKQRFTEAIKLLNAIDKKALDTGDYHTPLNAIQLKIECLSNIHISNRDEKHSTYLKESYEKYNNYLEKLKEETHLKQIYYELSIQVNQLYFQKPIQVNEKHLIAENRIKSILEFKKKNLDSLKEEDIEGILAKYHFLLSLTVCFTAIENYDELHRYTNKVYDLVSKHPFLKKQRTYPSLLINWAIPIIKRDQVENFYKIIKELELLIQSKHISYKYNVFVFWKHERIAAFYIHNKHHNLPDDLKKNFLQEIKKYDIALDNLIRLHIKYSLTYLFRNLYADARDIMQQTLIYNISSDNPDYTRMQLLNFILYYELGEYALQDRTLLSLRRNLTRSVTMDNILKELLHILQKATSTKYGLENRVKHLNNLVQFISKNEDSPAIYEQLSFLRDWASNKLKAII